MFNAIHADLACPETGRTSEDAEIQIKWQSPESRALSRYRAGDVLENIQDAYDDVWIRTDYICSSCSKHTKGRAGAYHIRVEDQKRHPVFIRIENGRICEILTEEAFMRRDIPTFVDY